MTDKHRVTLEWQAHQSRRIKALVAENNRLNSKIDRLLEVVTTENESKESFIARVSNILQEDVS